MWSVRAVVESVVEHGKRALHQVRRRQAPRHHPFQRQQDLQHKLSRGVREGAGEAAAVGCVAGRAGVVASRLRPFTTQLIQSIFRRVPAPLWTEARRRTTQRLVFGASAPYFALVGVTLVGGSHGLVTRDDELEALCGTVREAITRAGWLHNPEFWKSHKEASQQQVKEQQQEKYEKQELNGDEELTFSLADFTLGPVIDKGCNAVVYAARWKTDEHEEAQTSTGKCESQGAVARTPTTPCGPCEDVQQEKDTQIEAAETWHNEFPLAIKMMFNYEAESNAPAILKAMYKEILPAQCAQLDPAQQEWQERLCGPRVCLPPHPNIVDMPCVFVDRVPLLEGCLDLYPHALPARLNPQGYGRNMSLFCVMKRYDISLREYLQKYHPSQHTCLLLLTQLLEGLLHLHTNNIVHRDLKSDNILLSLAEGWQYPLLVVSDFGCSLVGDNSNLSVPFPSREADPRQGNAALMAPEVKTAMPGLLSSVFFGQSDLWAAGTLIYEIYGLDNPFSPAAALHRRSKQLDSATYKESHLPRLPRTAPPWIRHLTADILRRNPRTRPTVNVAATLCQLMLWAPSKWLNRHSLSLPTHTEVTQWLLCLATKVLCEARLPHVHASTQRERKRNAGLEGNADHQGSQLEYQLVSTFLGRVHYVDIIQAIKWNRAF
ncbi:serine/threonine-protein kinase Pink1, mitochondrial-like isoform X2 [Portunus trituberculatus]|uniref:serine/threonine-protein kinase Pink1, mitochondrial-like isoform X2 n=1 Tax=Portunus trituberculatus TaxID=210409 RepID=UPI001E1CC8E0|nr:serine/threonine-protein kinase Pink1, mitochondrial-like isoform X2 [Portunus trituberculatus]